MTSVELKQLAEVVRALQDPKLSIYYLLLSRRVDRGMPAISRKTLIATTRLSERIVDRSLRWLLEKKLVDRIRGRSETYYYPS